MDSLEFAKVMFEKPDGIEMHYPDGEIETYSTDEFLNKKDWPRCPYTLLVFKVYNGQKYYYRKDTEEIVKSVYLEKVGTLNNKEIWRCKKCGLLYTNDEKEKMRYCPECGRKIKGEN